MISKFFEQVMWAPIIHMYEHFLGCSPYQFGYKKKMGCNHAHFILEESVNFFVDRGSTVNLGTVDISKILRQIE